MMKFLLLVVLVVAVLGFASWRAERQRRPRRAAACKPLEMVRCAQCGLHLPRGDAVVAAGLFYCSDAHRVSGPPA